MSSYVQMTKHPITGEWEMALWVDDFFGSHCYGVKFPSDGEYYSPHALEVMSRSMEKRLEIQKRDKQC